jgi:hypothetical protein
MSRFYNLPSGYSQIGPLPSVTTILKDTINRKIYRPIYPGSVSASFIEQRAKIGTAVHKMVELTLLGYPLPPDLISFAAGEAYRLFQQVCPIVKGLRLYRNDRGVLGIERFVYSIELMVGGQVDLIIQAADGSLEVWDLKTSSAKKSKDQLHGYFLQTAAYAQCVRECSKLPVSRCVLLMVYSKPSPYSEQLDISGSALDSAILEFSQLRIQWERERNRAFG